MLSPPNEERNSHFGWYAAECAGGSMIDLKERRDASNESARRVKGATHRTPNKKNRTNSRKLN